MENKEPSKSKCEPQQEELEPKKEIVDDDELDALLDDALQDFGKTPEPKKRTFKCESAGDEEPDLNELLNDDALLKMSEGWNEVLKEMSSEDPSLMEEFQKFQKNFPRAGGNSSDESAPNFDNYMESALKDLESNLGGMNLEGEGMGDLSEMMKEMQANMGSDTKDGGSSDEAFPDGDAFMGMMQGMMENLLSKDLLYPSLKELKENYPSWLSDNEEKLTQEDYTKYKNQNDIIIQLCDLFEEESKEDTDQIKKQRTEKVIGLMQKMQVYGQPPSDMVSGISGSSPSLPAMPQQCSVM